MSKRAFEIDLPDEYWARIDRLVDAGDYLSDVPQFITKLLDHVQQGVYRSGAWERGWLAQCVGDEAIQAAYLREEDPLYRRENQ